jgi:hypothetical protein
MLSEGQYFFTHIEKEGILLYDAGNTPLAERKPLSPAEAKAIVPKEATANLNNILKNPRPATV